MQTGLAQTFGSALGWKKLVELGLIEATRNFGASASDPYRIVCPTGASFLLQYRRKISQASWNSMIRWRSGASIFVEELDAYMGLVFERVRSGVRQDATTPGIAYRARVGPMEGLDRDRRQTEIDIVAVGRMAEMVTGAVKWSAKLWSMALHDKHLDMLTR